MSVIQITLLIAGGIIFVISFFLPQGKQGRKNNENDINVITDDHVKLMVEREIDDSKSNINEIVDETVTYAMEKGERAMERITNEKIMAINEYSDTVLKEIHKNQQEVVFLYDMLNDKHAALLEVVSNAQGVISEVRQAGEAVSALNANQMNVHIEADEVIETNPSISLFNPQKISSDDLRILKDKPEMDNLDVADSNLAVDNSKSKGKSSSRNVDVHIGGSDSNNRNNNDIILEMHKSGKSNMAIARSLGLGISEVKLVIDLFEN